MVRKHCALAFVSRFLPVLCALAVSAYPLRANTRPDSVKSPWNKTLISEIHISQVGFSNWQKGGENAFSWVFRVTGDFAYAQPSYNLRTHGKIEYGQTRLKSSGTRTAQDEFFLETIWRSNKKYLNYYGSLRTETQFTRGFNYDTEPATAQSAFADPVYFYQSIGFIFTKNSLFSSRFGASFKQIRTEQYPKWADDPETTEIEKTRHERGFESVTELNYKFLDNMLLKSSVRLFSGLTALEEIDVNFDNQLTAKVNKYVSVTINYRLIYDWDVSKRAQIAEGFSMGIRLQLL